MGIPFLPFLVMTAALTPFTLLTDVWVLPSCSRVLYSQAGVHAFGVTHRLDAGYLLLPDGTRKTISSTTYTTIDLMFVLALFPHHRLPP